MCVGIREAKYQMKPDQWFKGRGMNSLAKHCHVMVKHDIQYKIYQRHFSLFIIFYKMHWIFYNNSMQLALEALIQTNDKHYHELFKVFIHLISFELSLTIIYKTIPCKEL